MLYQVSYKVKSVRVGDISERNQCILLGVLELCTQVNMMLVVLPTPKHHQFEPT